MHFHLIESLWHSYTSASREDQVGWVLMELIALGLALAATHEFHASLFERGKNGLAAISIIATLVFAPIIAVTVMMIVVCYMILLIVGVFGPVE